MVVVVVYIYIVSFMMGKRGSFSTDRHANNRIACYEAIVSLCIGMCLNGLPLENKGICLCVQKQKKNTQERAVSWVSAFLAQEKQKKSAHNWLQILTCDVAQQQWNGYAHSP